MDKLSTSNPKMHFFKFFALTILLLTSQISFSQDTLRVFFIGNSYTGANDLPNMTQRAAAAHGDVLIYGQELAGGQTLEGHWNNRVGLLANMAGTQWDYVVMQEQSQRPSFSPTQVEQDVFPYARKLDSLFKDQFDCVQSAFYMTWGRKNGDQANCPFYPPVCTYEGMQARLRESYIQMAEDNNAICLPVGEVWKNVRDNLPSIELYEMDGSHPNDVGSFIAASTIYTSLFHKAYTDSLPIVSNPRHFDQLAVQQFVTPTVFDSLETWNNDTGAAFTQFEDLVAGAYYSVDEVVVNGDFSIWDWGDGQGIDTILTGESLAHHYLYKGIYRITVTTLRGCESSESSHIVEIFHTSVDEEPWEFNIDELETIRIYNLNSQLILEGLPTILEDKRYLPTGIYLLEGKSGSAVMRKKIFLE